MCLIGFDWQPGSARPLRVLANRDEFYARPTAPLAWWAEGDILAGRDLQAGGSWMGISRSGRFAALTNVRDPSRQQAGAPSRGQLVVDALRSTLSASATLDALRERAAACNPFNLLIYDGRHLLGYESTGERLLRFGRGIHAVSNAGFDTAWPKLQRLKAGMRTVGEDEAALFALLADTSLAPDAQLPHTGVPLEWERLLSAIFIRSEHYGTRSTSLLTLGREEAEFIERSFEDGQASGERRYALRFTGLT